MGHWLVSPSCAGDLQGQSWSRSAPSLSRHCWLAPHHHPGGQQGRATPLWWARNISSRTHRAWEGRTEPRLTPGAAGDKSKLCWDHAFCHLPSVLLIAFFRPFLPWRRKWQPTPVLLPTKFHGWRSLVGYIQSMGWQKVGHDWVTSSTLLQNLTLSTFSSCFVSWYSYPATPLLVPHLSLSREYF